jgi:hypothetical protein
MERAHQLRVVRVGRRVLEDPQDVGGEQRMQTGVEFVDQERRPSVEGGEEGTDKANQDRVPMDSCRS